MNHIDGLVDEVKAAAKCVFAELGGGHSESVVECAMEVELALRGVTQVRRQVVCPIYYKESPVGYGFLDIVIGTDLIVELKAQTGISMKDEYQVQKYMTSMCIQNGLVVNFGLEKVTLRRVTLAEGRC